MNQPTPIMKPQTLARLALCEKVLRKCHDNMATQEQFFRQDARLVIECCEAMARAFECGARLIVLGNADSYCSAAHASDEFVQPIIAKRPALPAITLMADPVGPPAIGNDQETPPALSQQLRK